LNKPQDFTTMTKNECPSDCTTNGCCTNAWDAMALVAMAMPAANCTFCAALRYTVGRQPRDQYSTCQDCLMEDFKKVISEFQCQNDNGRCSKCCMDLALIYVSRFQSGCPTTLWQTVTKFQYKNTGFIYDGSSSCPAYSPSPQIGVPIVYENVQDLIDRTLQGAAPPLPSQDDYVDSSNIGLFDTNTGKTLLTPDQVLDMQNNGGVAG
jgi:hypothetical protein